jgi:hypothetical protein
METGICRQILVELTSSKFHEIRSVVNELVHANSRRDRCGGGNVRNMNFERKGENIVTELKISGRNENCP